PYFISDDHPVVLWDWVNQMLAELGIPPVSRRLPYGLVRGVAGVREASWSTLRLGGEPPLTPFVVDGFARSHWFDMAPAKRDLGYTPRVSPEAALAETVRWFNAAAAP